MSTLMKLLGRGVTSLLSVTEQCLVQMPTDVARGTDSTPGSLTCAAGPSSTPCGEVAGTTCMTRPTTTCCAAGVAHLGGRSRKMGDLPAIIRACADVVKYLRRVGQSLARVFGDCGAEAPPDAHRPRGRPRFGPPMPYFQTVRTCHRWRMHRFLGRRSAHRWAHLTWYDDDLS